MIKVIQLRAYAAGFGASNRALPRNAEPSRMSDI